MPYFLLIMRGSIRCPITTIITSKDNPWIRIIPHQANLRINEAFRERMNIPEEKMYNNIQRYGNTTAATIPIALDELMEKNMLKPKDTIMLIGLGAGLTWGGVIYTLI